MRSCLFMCMIFLFFSAFAELIPFNSEPRGSIIDKDGMELDNYYFDRDGNPQYLKQMYNLAALPHGVLFSRSLNYTQIFGKVATQAATVNSVEVKLTEYNRTEWIALRDSLSAKGIEIWPVVTYGAGEPFILTGEMGLVFRKFIDETKRRELLQKFNLTVIETAEDDPGYYLIKMKAGTDPFKLAQDLFLSGMVVWSQPNWYMTLIPYSTTPNDTYYSSQWHLNEPNNMGDINAPEAWDITTGNAAVKAAVIDSGVQLNHPDLQANIDPIVAESGYLYDYLDGDNDPSAKLVTSGQGTQEDNAGYAHGTACSGIIAAVGNNNIGMTGICWNCKIIPIRLVGGYPSSADAQLKTLKLATIKGAAVINNSYGVSMRNNQNQCKSIPNDNYRAQGVQYAKESGRGGKGTMVVWAAGNDSCPTNLDPGFANNDIVVVSALEKNGAIASYSNYGTEVDVSAPAASYTIDISGAGGMNSSVYADNTITQEYTSGFNGTSAAAPVTSGAIALMVSENQDLTFNQMMNCLKNSAKKDTNQTCAPGGWTSQSDPYVENGSAQHSQCFGFGKVDVFAMVKKARDGQCGSAAIDCTKTSDVDICAGTGYGIDDNCNGKTDENCDTGGNGKTGEACTTALQCGNAGPDPICITTMPDGFCSANCAKDADCWNSGFCINKQCQTKCDSTTILRNGYTCSFGQIVIKCKDDASCGTNKKCNTVTGLCEGKGCSAPGASCVSSSDCMGPGYCYKGFCLQDCTMTKKCLGDAECIYNGGTPPVNFCFDSCDSTANCNKGALCVNNNGKGICLPKCQIDSDCGGQKCNSGLCGTNKEMTGTPTTEPNYDGDWCGGDGETTQDTVSQPDSSITTDQGNTTTDNGTVNDENAGQEDTAGNTTDDSNTTKKTGSSSGCSLVSI